MPRRIIALLLTCVVACAPWLLAAGGDQSPSQRSRGDAVVTEIADCRVKLIDEVVLSSGQSGILEQVALKEGDVARKDEVVAAIRDNIVRSALATAEKQAENDVEVRYAHKAADLARIAYSKAMQSNQTLKGAVPEIEIRELRLAAEKAILQVEQAEHRLSVAGLERDEARELLKTYFVQAPFDATVTKVYKKRGEAVREGEPIIELSNSERMRVEAWLPLKDAWRIRPGMPVTVHIDNSEDDPEIRQIRFAGHVTLVDTKLEPVTQSVRVWAEVANRDGVLKDGLSATIRIRRRAGNETVNLEDKQQSAPQPMTKR